MNWSPAMVYADDGFIYLPAFYRDEILCYDRDLNFVRSFGSTGEKPGQLKQPFSLVLLSEYLYVLESGNNRIQVFNRKGLSEAIFGNKGLKNQINDMARLFSWGDKLLFLQKKKHFLGVYSQDMELLRKLPCHLENQDRIIFVKELNGRLYFPLRNGELFRLNDCQKEWLSCSDYPSGEHMLSFLTDIISLGACWLFLDCATKTIYKSRENNWVFRTQITANNPYKGVYDGKHLYIVSSDRNVKGKGKIQKFIVDSR